MNLTILPVNSKVVTPFSFENCDIRTLQIDGQPWFFAADACGVLDLGNVTMALKRLDDDEQALISIDGISRGNDQINVINESGLYSLILGSRKPNARKFKRWVTGEVLPAIRKTGGYGIQAAPVMALPQDYIQALESLLASKKSEQLAIEQRDHAIATKAQIGSKREATSMATASAARKEAAKLKDQLGFSARHATIMQVEYALGGDFNFLPLRNWCKASEVTPETVPDKRYPKGVKAWPAGAWMACYSVNLVELFGEVVA